MSEQSSKQVSDVTVDQPSCSCREKSMRVRVRVRVRVSECSLILSPIIIRITFSIITPLFDIFSSKSA